jgi:hypothetical protein
MRNTIFHSLTVEDEKDYLNVGNYQSALRNIPEGLRFEITQTRSSLIVALGPYSFSEMLAVILFRSIKISTPVVCRNNPLPHYCIHIRFSLTI